MKFPSQNIHRNILSIDQNLKYETQLKIQKLRNLKLRNSVQPKLP